MVCGMGRSPVVSLVESQSDGWAVWRVRMLGDFVNGFAFRDANGAVTLLDVGLPWSTRRVLAALAAIDSGPSDVARIMVTHAHSDHVGAAASLAARTGRAVDVHEADAAYVAAGESPPMSGLGGLVSRVVPGFAAAPVGVRLVDGQLLGVAGGLRVLHTPGHSPGHVSFLHEPSRLLITGDAIFNIRGPRWPVKAFCTDFQLNRQTARLLGDLDYTMAAFTHGPELRDSPREAIRDFLRREASGAVGGGT